MDDRTVPPDVMKPSSNHAIIEFVDLCSEGEEDNLEKENMAKSMKAKSSLPIEESDDDLSASYPTTFNATVACTEDTSNKTSKEVEGEISNKFLQPSEVTKEQVKDVANGNKRRRLSESSKEQSVVDSVSKSSILMYYIPKESDQLIKSIGDKRRYSVDVHSVIAKQLIEADSTTVVSSSQASTESFKSPSKRRKTSKPQKRLSNRQTSNSIPKKINTPDRNDDSDEDRKYALPATSTKPNAQKIKLRIKKKFTVVRKKSVKRKPKASKHNRSINRVPTSGNMKPALNVLNNDCQMFANNNRGCVLCNDKPRNLTNHYIRKHKTESYISRLSRSQLDDLLSNTPFVTEVKGPAGSCIPYYSIECKFCNLNLNEPFSELYDHYSSHTGEYAYYCNKCKLSRPYRPDIESHQKHTKLCSNSGIQVMYSYKPGARVIYLYYCNICNFVQLNEANILKHLREHHGPQHLNGNIKKCILAAISDAPDTNTKGRSNASSSKSVTTTPVPSVVGSLLQQESQVMAALNAAGPVSKVFKPLIIKSESMDDEDNRLTPQIALNSVTVNSTREKAINDDSTYTYTPERQLKKLHENTSRQDQTAPAAVVARDIQKQQPRNMAAKIGSKSPGNTSSIKSMTTTPDPLVVISSLQQQSQVIADLKPAGPNDKFGQQTALNSVTVNSTREKATNDDSKYALEQQLKKLPEDTTRQEEAAPATVVVNKTQKQQPPNMATTIASKSPSNTCSTKSMTTTPVPSVVGSSLQQESQVMADLNAAGPVSKVFKPLILKSESMDDEDNRLTPPPRQQTALNSVTVNSTREKPINDDSTYTFTHERQLKKLHEDISRQDQTAAAAVVARKMQKQQPPNMAAKIGSKSPGNTSSTKSMTTTPVPSVVISSLQQQQSQVIADLNPAVPDDKFVKPLIIKSESMDDENNRLTPPPGQQTALNSVTVNSTREKATNDDSKYAQQLKKLHEDTTRQEETVPATVVVNKMQKQQPPNMATTIASKSPSNTCSTKSMTTTPVPSVVGSSLQQQSQVTGPVAKVFKPLVIKSESMDHEDNRLTPPPRQQTALNSVTVNSTREKAINDDSTYTYTPERQLKKLHEDTSRQDQTAVVARKMQNQQPPNMATKIGSKSPGNTSSTKSMTTTPVPSVVGSLLQQESQVIADLNPTGPVAKVFKPLVIKSESMDDEDNRLTPSPGQQTALNSAMVNSTREKAPNDGSIRTSEQQLKKLHENTTRQEETVPAAVVVSKQQKQQTPNIATTIAPKSPSNTCSTKSMTTRPVPSVVGPSVQQQPPVLADLNLAQTIANAIKPFIIKSNPQPMDDEDNNLTPPRQQSATNSPMANSTVSLYRLSYRIYPIHVKYFGLYKCLSGDCYFNTDCPEEFKQHLQNHSQETLCLKCPYCCFSLRQLSIESLIDHTQQEHSHMLYQCSGCCYRSLDASNVLLHQKEQHSDENKMKIYKCSGVELTINEDSLNDKLKSISPKIPCPYCSGRQSFYNTNLLKQHIQNYHRFQHNEKYYSCIYCGHVGKGEEILKKHLVLWHPNEFPFICNHNTNDIPKDDCVEHLQLLPVATSSITTIIDCTAANAADLMTDVKPNVEEFLKCQEGNVKNRLRELTKKSGISLERLYRCPEQSCTIYTTSYDLWLHHVRTKHRCLVCKCPHCPSGEKVFALEEFKTHFDGHRRHIYLCYHCPQTFASYEDAVTHASAAEHVQAFGQMRMEQIIIDSSFSYFIQIGSDMFNDRAEFIPNLLNILNERLRDQATKDDSLRNSWPIPTENKPKWLEDFPTDICRKLEKKCFNGRCEFRATETAELFKHVRENHKISGSTFSCRQCDFNIINCQHWDDILAHIQQHSDSSFFICGACSAYFYNRSMMAFHIREKHDVRDVPLLNLVKIKRQIYFRLAIVFATKCLSFSTMCNCFCCEEKDMNGHVYILHLERYHKFVLQYFCEWCNLPIESVQKVQEHFSNLHTRNSLKIRCELSSKYDLKIISLRNFRVQIETNGKPKDNMESNDDCIIISDDDDDDVTD
ncbi:uncharacterized protein isoform X2 [Musca autumnalis]|uniref:uncharacterized protein isoform X2 n=1 Tax=Musca autumnalis TaxID=221902 RepID=UPI003CF93123